MVNAVEMDFRNNAAKSHSKIKYGMGESKLEKERNYFAESKQQYQENGRENIPSKILEWKPRRNKENG